MLIRFKQLYSNEYDITASNNLKYNHEALLMLSCTDRPKRCFIFSALRFILPVQKIVDFYFTSIGLLSYPIICIARLALTLIDLALHLVHKFLTLVVSYSAWQLLRSSSHSYLLASHTFCDLFFDVLTQPFQFFYFSIFLLIFFYRSHLHLLFPLFEQPFFCDE